MEESGRNFTPDKLPKAQKGALFDACNRALREVVNELRPKYVIGVGAFAETRIKAAIEDNDLILGRILHPSPASPAANKNWAKAAETALTQLGIRV